MSASLTSALKAECNFYVNGQCTTVACLKRDDGGKRAALPIQLVGCIEYRALKEISRLRDALQMIADETICPEAFPDWDTYSEAQQSHISALLIAEAALEGGEK